MAITLTVNGAPRAVEAAPDTPLLWVLRDELGLKGTKFGCGVAACGACTVHVDGVPTRSCSMPIEFLEGAEVTTIEGMANPDGSLGVIQAAFREHHGLQCGFCTPGMIMSAADLLKQNADPSEAEVRDWLEGNICRCTGYHNIVKAILAAGAEMRGQPVAAE
ncbi:MAG: (2Fe-2S)-binding protein [Pseudomonadota bacterium]